MRLCAYWYSDFSDFREDGGETIEKWIPRNRQSHSHKMAYQKPTGIDGYVKLMAKADMRVKALLAEDLVAFLSDPENSIVSDDLGLLVDGLMPWLTGSHFKVNYKFSMIWDCLICRIDPIGHKWHGDWFDFIYDTRCHDVSIEIQTIHWTSHWAPPLDVEFIFHVPMWNEISATSSWLCWWLIEINFYGRCRELSSSSRRAAERKRRILFFGQFNWRPNFNCVEIVKCEMWLVGHTHTAQFIRGGSWTSTNRPNRPNRLCVWVHSFLVCRLNTFAFICYASPLHETEHYDVWPLSHSTTSLRHIISMSASTVACWRIEYDSISVWSHTIE